LIKELSMKVPTNLRKRLRHSLLILLGGVLLALPLWAQAQQAPILSAADKQAITSYNFNDDNFNRLVSITKAAHDQGIRPQKPADMSKVHDLDDLASLTVSADPRIQPLLKKYGFSPREFLIANFALMNAGMAVQAKNQPEAAKYLDKSRINAANVSFYEAHEAQIAALQEQLDDGQDQGQ
jgi:hypothetical protein